MIYTCILPAFALGLRGGLHPFVPTNTLHLPVDTALESLQCLLYFKPGNTTPVATEATVD